MVQVSWQNLFVDRSNLYNKDTFPWSFVSELFILISIWEILKDISADYPHSAACIFEGSSWKYHMTLFIYRATILMSYSCLLYSHRCTITWCLSLQDAFSELEAFNISCLPCIILVLFACSYNFFSKNRASIFEEKMGSYNHRILFL